MMFDNSPPTTPSRKIGEHVAMAALVGGAFAAAIGMHMASLTVAVIGVGHLLIAGAVIAIRGRNNRYGS